MNLAPDDFGSTIRGRFRDAGRLTAGALAERTRDCPRAGVDVGRGAGAGVAMGTGTGVRAGAGSGTAAGGASAAGGGGDG
ncbi:MAG: hypothetical protein M3546_10370, partial [Actinomycetota bacterium]|nr:hypothetical protein [Actinomycetota bacterium]